MQTLRQNMKTNVEMCKKLIKIYKRIIEIHIERLCKMYREEFFCYVKKEKIITSAIGTLEKSGIICTDIQVQMTNILYNYFVFVATEENFSISSPTPTPQASGTSYTSIFRGRLIKFQTRYYWRKLKPMVYRIGYYIT